MQIGSGKYEKVGACYYKISLLNLTRRTFIAYVAWQSKAIFKIVEF